MSLVSFIVAVMLNACCGFAGVSFFQKVSFWSHWVPVDGFDFIWHHCDKDVTVMTYKNKPFAYLMNCRHKVSAIFVSQPVTVYEVDFSILDLWFLDGFKTGNHIGFCGILVIFHLKKWGAQPKFCLTIRFLALKPCLAFMVKKTISSNDYFLVLFLVVSHWFFGVHFPIFLFLGLCGCSIFVGCCWPFFLEMFYKKHNIVFVGRGKKGSLDFLKKQFNF